MKKAVNKIHKNEETHHKTRIGRLKTADDVSKYLARCIRKAEGGGSENKYYKLTMMASILLKSLEMSSLEKRIKKLESSMEGK